MRGSFPLSVSLVYRMKLLEQWNTENNYANISQSLPEAAVVGWRAKRELAALF